MLFSSIPFLYYFIPAVLMLYFVMPLPLKNTVLMLSSLFFYGWGEPIYLLLMTVSIAIGYISGLLLERAQKLSSPTHSALWSNVILWVTVAIDLGFLAYFKYADFFIENFSAATGLAIPLLRLALPIGISFYTFQIMSYTVDVYRKEVPAQRNPVYLAAYVTMFPQLIAGPIVRYSDIAAQLSHRRHTFPMISDGIRRFVIGLSKKVLIADTLGKLVSTCRAGEEQSVLFFWLYAVAFALQLYFDFSGYSDMAIGLGRILGFKFLENFNYPYISRSITEFWRRWHMSLGSWFRDYVYIPLGGNRCGKARWFFNIFVVWMLTGFWHGAAWNFIAWGLLYAVFLILEKLWLKKYLDRFRILSHIYVLLITVLGFVLFNAQDMGQAWTDTLALFGGGGYPLVSTESLYHLNSYALLFVIAIIGATPLPKLAVEKIKSTHIGGTVLAVAEPIVTALLLLLVTGYLVDSSFSPFLYFRF